MIEFLSSFTMAESAQIVGAFLSLSALAWGVGLIARLVLNR